MKALVGVFAVSALAAEAGAWCPSVDGTTISCSNCSRTLTCNYSGGIYITGDNVVLDGGNYTLSNSTGHGISVTGGNASISNLVISNAASSGIFFDEVDGALDNVYIDNSGVYAVYAYQSTLDIGWSWFSYSNFAGVQSEQENSKRVDMLGTYTEYNQTGLREYWAYNSVRSYNYYQYNDWNGALDIEGDAGAYNSSSFYGNGTVGLKMLDRSEGYLDLDILLGYDNGTRDCEAANVNGLNVSGCSWGVHLGCDNDP